MAAEGCLFPTESDPQLFKIEQSQQELVVPQRILKNCPKRSG
jgi:hypothetical protein